MNNDINSRFMNKFFASFNVMEKKFFYNSTPESIQKNKDKIFERYTRENRRKYWSIKQATETFLTLDKVYNKSQEESMEFCNLLQTVTEDFLGNYVNIDGIEELFHSSYFYFEWMMHLEYKEQEHSYSFYRDHYLHQIRNLYEMFIFLDELQMWRNCMEIYKSKNNATANRIHESIDEQIKVMNPKEKEVLESIAAKDQQPGFLEEFCYHYLFFAVAIVASLIHDIGYPVSYVQRTVNRLKGFLPLSYLFIKVEDQMPRINSLLKASLLYEVVDQKEIEKRLLEHDHGVYSAIILLFHFYDNGQIFQLPPLKRMVIELSALVIYNHTLRYHYQDPKKAYRYQNVYNENPLSYLFRLCDDLQEWERVYFEISTESNFFVCNQCKMPMIRNLKAVETKQGRVPYHCFCQTEGINTNLFSYRRLINVEPFSELLVQHNDKKIKLNLKCDLDALLQTAKYNPTFAIQRVKGILEIKEMLKEQEDFPLTYVDTFISNNPIAIKVKILQHYIKDRVKRSTFSSSYGNYIRWLDKFTLDETQNNSILNVLHELINKKNWWHIVLEVFAKDIEHGVNHNDRKNGLSMSDWSKAEKLIQESLNFYLYLLILGQAIQNNRKKIIDKLKIDSKNIGEQLFDYFNKWADAVCRVWHIYDDSSSSLISDYLQQAFCEINAEDFDKDSYSLLYYHYLKTRLDMADIVKTYIKNDMYAKICKTKGRKQANGEILFDYYSDYYFFFIMYQLVKESKKKN